MFSNYVGREVIVTSTQGRFYGILTLANSRLVHIRNSVDGMRAFETASVKVELNGRGYL